MSVDQLHGVTVGRVYRGAAMQSAASRFHPVPRPNPFRVSGGVGRSLPVVPPGDPYLSFAGRATASSWFSGHATCCPGERRSRNGVVLVPALSLPLGVSVSFFFISWMLSSSQFGRGGVPAGGWNARSSIISHFKFHVFCFRTLKFSSIPRFHCIRGAKQSCPQTQIGHTHPDTHRAPSDYSYCRIATISHQQRRGRGGKMRWGGPRRRRRGGRGWCL